jgi:hypothetical protein
MWISALRASVASSPAICEMYARWRLSRDWTPEDLTMILRIPLSSPLIQIAAAFSPTFKQEITSNKAYLDNHILLMPHSTNLSNFVIHQ